MEAMRHRTPLPKVSAAVLGPFLALAFGLLAAPALAGGGNVLPATARPHGYSLSDMAAAVADFNAGPRTPGTEPDVPFQILYTHPSLYRADIDSYAFTVRTGTMFYVPVLWVDNSPPILGHFPDDVTNQADAADYLFDRKQLGAEFIEIVVDGVETFLGRDYVVGVELSESLPDNEPHGYISPAAFLTPLTKGTHTIELGAKLSGDAWRDYGGGFEFSTRYQVTVR